MTRLAIAAEDIRAETGVWLLDGKVYSSATQATWPLEHNGEHVGEAVETIREGLRVAVSDNGEVREDDA